eukprot:TRINITY_DN17460_c0_g1_i1.p1 TRINITY_DN17460_c0_g1~~TRINITY_DN17460_c0_g1_i1.p1  ORF type:complete len:358 (+),score=75.01 TRINITY_DN17460_c0_g1_i1:58-1074(+)
MCIRDRYHLLPESSALYPSAETSRNEVVDEISSKKLKRVPSSPHIGRENVRSPVQSNVLLGLHHRNSEPNNPESSVASDEITDHRKFSFAPQQKIPEEPCEEEKDIVEIPPANPSPLTRKGSKGGQIKQRLMNFESFPRRSKELSSPHFGNVDANSLKKLNFEEKKSPGQVSTRPLTSMVSGKEYGKDNEGGRRGSLQEGTEEIMVLIVDDDSFSVLTMERFIKGKGNWKHRIVMNGDDAVDEIQRNYEKYHCVIMDCEMPGKDGYDATREIREFEASHKSSSRIPIFGVSGNEAQEDREKALNAGMTKYFTKPVDFPSFLGELYENATSFKIMKRFG